MEIVGPDSRAVDRFCWRSCQAQPSNSIPPDFSPGEDLPEWLLEEILIRLPLKCAFRLRCVSREWLLHLSSPSFRCRFLSSRASSPPSWTLLYGYMRAPEDIPSGMRLERGIIGDSPAPRFTVLPSSLGTLQILGSSNGLLLCCRSWRDVFYIYNPLTLQCVALPQGTSWIEPTREGLITEVEGGEIKGYKVIQVGQTPESPDQLFLDVFSSELDTWTNHRFSSPCPGHFPKPFPDFRFARPVTVKDTLYLPDYNERILIAFNPYASPEGLSVVCLPNQELERLPAWFELCDVFQEKLRHYTVSEARENPTLKVWELKDSSNGGEWALEHSCRWSEIQWDDARLGPNVSHRIFLPLSFHPSDPNIMYLWNTKCIASYDMKAGRMEVFCELDSGFRGLSWESVIPFVLPHWPATVPHPAWKMEGS